MDSNVSQSLTTNQLTHEQNTNTNPKQNTNILSLLNYEGLQEVTQNLTNNKDGFKNLFPSINFIQSLWRVFVEDVHRSFESLVENEEEPCCSKNVNPVIGPKVYCPICNNPFSISTIEEHAALCL